MDIRMIANDGKQLTKMVTTTVTAYKKVAAQLHNTACAVMFHAAQYGECSALNKFYEGLRVNDQTALRVWLGAHSGFVDLNTGTTRNWISFTKKDGFRVVKGTESYRKDMYRLGDVEGDNEQTTDLLALKPFYDKDVKDKDSVTIEALIAMIGKAAEKAEKQADKEGLALPADILKLTQSIRNTTSKELAAIERAKEMAGE